MSLEFVIYFLHFYSGFFAIALRWIFLKVRKIDPLGMGDVGFFAVCGLILGIKIFNYFILLTGFSGLILGLVWKKFYKKEYFPFIPAMVLSLIICMKF
jgi:prepilin signal peptidase PulO-like enzyme (type II secretory pathway)